MSAMVWSSCGSGTSSSERFRPRRSSSIAEAESSNSYSRAQPRPCATSCARTLNAERVTIVHVEWHCHLENTGAARPVGGGGHERRRPADEGVTQDQAPPTGQRCNEFGEILEPALPLRGVRQGPLSHECRDDERQRHSRSIARRSAVDARSDRLSCRSGSSPIAGRSRPTRRCPRRPCCWRRSRPSSR